MAENHTLRIAVAVVTFYRNPFLVIEKRLAERTGDDTGSASDAEFLINDHTVILVRFPVAGLGRADFDAKSFFTVITRHGKVNPLLFPFGDFDPGTARVACSGMIDRADQLTLAAARTFLLIDHKDLLLHLSLLNLPVSGHIEIPPIVASGSDL